MDYLFSHATQLKCIVPENVLQEDNRCCAGFGSIRGATFVRLWVGEANNDTSAIPLAILYKRSPGVSMEMIYVYSLHYSVGDRIILLLDSSVQHIPLEEGALIDVKITSNKIWILKEDGLIMLGLFNTTDNGGVAQCYSLQEAVVADQLFQSSEHSSDDLLWLAQSIFSSLKLTTTGCILCTIRSEVEAIVRLHPLGSIVGMSWCRTTRVRLGQDWTGEEPCILQPFTEPCFNLNLDMAQYDPLEDQIVPFVSSIFLRRLLSPGVLQSTVLRATFQDYNKHLANSEFYSLTVDRLKMEILSLVEHEGISESPVSILYRWKTFCTRYFHCWCKMNAPIGFLIDSSMGAIGLIRKNSVSLFRCLEDIEFLIYGSFDELGDIVSSGLDLSDDNVDREILFEVLRCVSNVSQQLGKGSSAIFYESLLSAPSISSEEVVPRLLKILETGYSSSVTAFHISELGADIAWEKEMADHKNLRKFSVDMFLSLLALSNKATAWGKVLDVIENYLKFLVPRKIIQKFDSDVGFNINTCVMIQATSQVAKVMFESSLDILLLLSYLVNIGGQDENGSLSKAGHLWLGRVSYFSIHILHDDISRIQLELVPMIQEIITDWHIIHFLGTTSSESPATEDFSYQLSSLQIDNNIDKRSWNVNLGKCDFTLACILLLNFRSSSEDQAYLSVKCLPDPGSFISSVRNFTSWIMWGRTGEETPAFFSHSTELALILLRHGQYDAVEYLLTIVDAHSRKEKISESIQSGDGEWGILLHLLGCCLLAQAQRVPQGLLKEKKVSEAVRCFFRASSVQGAPQALQGLSYEAGLPHLGFTDCQSAAVWKLHYYQWAMQIFEQYNLSEGACQFALAALEQVDESLGSKDDNSGADTLNESVNTVKGRLWANVFKFTLDLNYYYDAYCAIISNPDEESKNICLRRFIIVLYERGSIKILCDGQLPFIGLTEKVERELAWKAGRSDISAKPNPFKLLYAFEMRQHNWRRAATYIYLYSAQLKAEAAFKDHQRRSLVLQERLNGLSATINALHLVHPAYAWIDPLLEESSLQKEHYSTAGNGIQTQRLQSYVDVEKLENEFVLTSAEYMLSLANVKWTFTGNEKPPPDLVDLLLQADLYDMAFTVILKFWKGSGLKRELERVFIAMSLKCCPNRVGPSLIGNDIKMSGLLLTSSKDEVVVHGSLDTIPPTHQSKGNTQWETLELYLEKYKGFHSRLPVIVAETLLSADPQIELPLWLVQMFKHQSAIVVTEASEYFSATTKSAFYLQIDSRRTCGIVLSDKLACKARPSYKQKPALLLHDRLCSHPVHLQESTLGMTGNEANPAFLFQLYVDYGRYAEATNLLLEYFESFASMRPTDIIRRKRPSAAWFPYTTIERLWCQLEELIRMGHMVDQCEKLKNLIRGALRNHLNLLREDSDDVQSSAAC
ncbi:hypothetical protein TEA_026867 [Camellia sinensis var. sinensis]|uniref:Uncharacterized protein n=1 Tax=Camellia sinensis var. sinensis TaxID=542762 RepID=A0A4S4E9D1_CAMSN|nr:hypothetical protein TEA_026867 [Camellia sinensis var. sinensis]